MTIVLFAVAFYLSVVVMRYVLPFIIFLTLGLIYTITKLIGNFFGNGKSN